MSGTQKVSGAVTLVFETFVVISTRVIAKIAFKKITCLQMRIRIFNSASLLWQTHCFRVEEWEEKDKIASI